MAFSYMKSKTKPIFSNASSTSFRENGVSRLFQNLFKPHLPQTPFAGTSFTRFYMVSAATVLGGARRLHYSRGGFMGGARRFCHSNRNLDIVKVAASCTKSLSSRPSGSKFWSLGRVFAMVAVGSCLLYGVRIERVPYSNRFHLTLSRRLEKDLGDYEWPEIFVNSDSNFDSILPSSDPRSIRVQSIARKLLDSMREGLMLQQQLKMVAPKPQESKNHTRNLIWKPATKHLDGKAWEVYVTEYGSEAFCLDNGKIAIGSGLLKDLKSDDEVAAVIAHEIKDAHKGGKVSSEKGGSKQSMAVDAKPLKISKKKAQDAKSFTTQDKAKGKSTLKERQEKKYPFPDSDVASMLDELLKSKVIELPEMKRPEESDKVDDPNYCKYHRLVSHPVEKCFVLKDKIMELHREGLIEFEEEVASSNVASVTK
ncbi:Peptidase M48, partial [Corchorus capsularis]